MIIAVLNLSQFKSWVYHNMVGAVLSSRPTHLLKSLSLETNVRHKDWLIYSGRIDQPGAHCYNFSVSNDLTQRVNFPTRIPDFGSHSPALLDFFLSSDASICSTMASLHCEILIMLLCQFPLTFQLIHNGMSHSMA